MKLLFRLCGVFLLCAWLPAAQGQFISSLKIAKIEIKHVGPPRVGDDLIRANLRVHVGDLYRAGAVDDDVRNLYATGLFYNIQVTTSQEPGVGLVLTYVVQAKPRLTEIKFQGNTKYSDAKLRKKLSSKVGEPLDERKLFTDSQEIQKLYQKAGYPGTTVKAYPTIIEETGRATAVFEIHESPKIKITDVEFVGAEAFSQGKLRKVIKTRRHWMFSWLTGSGVFKEDQFEDDRETLTDFYRSKGYIDFEIKDVQFEHPTTNTMIVRFIIYEGHQYKVGTVTLTGNKLFTTAQITASLRAMQPSGALKKIKLGPHGLKMDSGDVFTPEGLNGDIQQIQDFYGSRGYIDVTAPRSLGVERIPNTETGTIDLQFKIDEGQKSYIEKIEIRGNTKTKDRVIRRELAVAPGEVFDMVRVQISKDRLQGLNYFEHVDLRPEPTDVPSHKDLVVNVEEKNTGNVTLGAGFSSVDSLVGFAEVTQGNFDLFKPPTFTGGGQKLRLRAQLGTQRQDYEAEFIEPWFLQRKLAFDFNLFYHDLDFLSPNNLYHEIDAGGRVSLRRALGSDHLIGVAGYSLEDIGIIFNNQVTGATYPDGTPGQTIPPTPVSVPNTLLAQQGYALVSKFFGSIAYDTRGPGFLPEKGQRTELLGEIAGPFGGVQDYYKLQLKTAWYFKGLAPGHVLELVGRTGLAESYGNTDEVPFYDRYYLGGLYDLRGFRFHYVSPREPNSGSNEPIGGDSFWFASAEYSIPVISMVRLAAFFDVGQVLLRSNPSYPGQDISDDAGVGLRLNLPIGPLRLDYAIPIQHDQFSSSAGRFQFSVGYARPF